MPNKEKYTVSIMGRQYNLLSDKSPEDISALEEIINKQIKSIKEDNTSLSNDMVSALTLLYFAEDIYKNKELLKKYETDVISLKFENENLKSSSRESKSRMEEFKNKYDEISKLYNMEKEDNAKTKLKLQELNEKVESIVAEKDNLTEENKDLINQNRKLSRNNREVNDKIDNVIRELEKIKDGN